MAAEMKMVKDGVIRQRMLNDCREERKLLASELEHYAAEFWPGEEGDIKKLIKTYDSLIRRLENN